MVKRKVDEIDGNAKISTWLTRKAPKATSPPAAASKSDNSTSSTSKKHDAVDLTQEPDADRIHIVEETGNLFHASINAVLIHACNAEGSWGAGIAQAFRMQYPKAFKIYQDHCKNCKKNDTTLTGTALLIPPQSGDPQHYIGCLFNSKYKGKKKDSKSVILDNTEHAMDHLVRLITELDKDDVAEIDMCKINSGLFDVPWEETKQRIQNVVVEGGMTITMKEPAKQQPKAKGKR